MKPRIRIWIVTVMLAVPLAGGGPARADEPCPATDPACVVEEVVDDPIGSVEGAAGDVGSAVQPVLDEANRILGSGGDDPTGGGGNGDPPGGGSGDRGRGGRGGGTRSGHEAGPLPGPATRPPLVAGPTLDLTTPGAPRPDLNDRITRTLSAAVPGLATVLILLFVAGAFVAIQDRVDRRDPRLALAPVTSDVVGFA